MCKSKTSLFSILFVTLFITYFDAYSIESMLLEPISILGDNGVFTISKYQPYSSGELDFKDDASRIFAGIQIEIEYKPSIESELKFIQIGKPQILKDYEKERATRDGWTLDRTNSGDTACYGNKGTTFKNFGNSIWMSDTPHDIITKTTTLDVNFITMIFDTESEKYIDAIKWGYHIHAGSISVLAIERIYLSDDSFEYNKINESIEKWNEQQFFKNNQSMIIPTLITSKDNEIQRIEEKIEIEKEKQQHKNEDLITQLSKSKRLNTLRNKETVSDDEIEFKLFEEE